MVHPNGSIKVSPAAHASDPLKNMFPHVFYKGCAFDDCFSLMGRQPMPFFDKFDHRLLKSIVKPIVLTFFKG